MSLRDSSQPYPLPSALPIPQATPTPHHPNPNTLIPPNPISQEPTLPRTPEQHSKPPQTCHPRHTKPTHPVTLPLPPIPSCPALPPRHGIRSQACRRGGCHVAQLPCPAGPVPSELASRAHVARGRASAACGSGAPGGGKGWRASRIAQYGRRMQERRRGCWVWVVAGARLCSGVATFFFLFGLGWVWLLILDLGSVGGELGLGCEGSYYTVGNGHFE